MACPAPNPGKSCRSEFRGHPFDHRSGERVEGDRPGYLGAYARRGRIKLPPARLNAMKHEPIQQRLHGDQRRRDPGYHAAVHLGYSRCKNTLEFRDGGSSFPRATDPNEVHNRQERP